VTERLDAIAEPGKPTLNLTRVFDASRDVVFEAWTTPEHLAKWWGPKGFTTTTHAFAFEVGGAWRFTMHGPDGVDYPNRIVYDAIARPERIAYSHFGGEDGLPAEFKTTVTFEAQGDKTKVTMRALFPSANVRDTVAKTHGAIEGGQQTLARLAEHVGAMPREREKLVIIADPVEPTIVTRRVVDAPRSLVFDAFTKPEHLKRWMGPRALTTVVCEVDLRVGGRWRMVHRAPDGQELALHGEIREIVRPVRIVRTFVFEPMPEHEALETLALEEHDGKTTITTTTVHKTLEARDGHIAGGRMQAGMSDGYARLDEHLAALRG
jgi:uncharacterized protein YndB with AHSA1/START domain